MPEPAKLLIVGKVNVTRSNVPPLRILILRPVALTFASRLTVNPFKIYMISLLEGIALPTRVAPVGSVVQVPATAHKPELPPFVYVYNVAALTRGEQISANVMTKPEIAILDISLLYSIAPKPILYPKRNWVIERWL